MVVDQVTEAQQNLRAVADLIERDVRRAGYMVPPHAAICGYDQTAGPDTLFVTNADVLRSVFGLEGAAADLSGNLGAPVSGTNSTWSASGGSFSLSLDRKWVDIQADGAKESLPIEDPATREVLGRVPLSPAADVDAAVAAAGRAFPDWRARAGETA